MRDLYAKSIESLCDHKEELKLGDGLVEGPAKPRKAKVESKIRTVYQTVVNRVNASKLVKFHAGERFELLLEQEILAMLTQTHALANYESMNLGCNKEDLEKSVRHCIRQLGNSLVGDDSNNLDPQKITTYQGMLESILGNLGLKNFVTLENLKKEFPGLPNDDVFYPKFRNLNNPIGMMMLPSLMPKLAYIAKRFSYLKVLRECAIRDNFEKLGFGTHPMVIGSDHVSRLISILEDVGIPVVILSAQKGRLKESEYNYQNSKKEIDEIVSEYKKACSEY